MVRNSIFCEHANECPTGPCTCDEDCYCKQPGNMCNKVNKKFTEYAPLMQDNSYDMERRVSDLERRVKELESLLSLRK